MGEAVPNRIIFLSNVFSLLILILKKILEVSAGVYISYKMKVKLKEGVYECAAQHERDQKR